MLRYTVVIEPTRKPEHPGWYYAHVPVWNLPGTTPAATRGAHRCQCGLERRRRRGMMFVL